MNIFQVAGNEVNVDDPANSNQVKSDAGNVSISKITDNNAAPTEGQSNKQEVTPEGENPMIVIDGPLGRAYTQALNLAYSKEDTGTVTLIAGAMDQQLKNKEAGNPQEGTYVYVMDGSDITQKQCVDAANWMTKQHAAGITDIVISLEGHMIISPRARQIEDHAKSTGAKVVNSKKGLMKHVAAKKQAKSTKKK